MKTNLKNFIIATSMIIGVLGIGTIICIVMAIYGIITFNPALIAVSVCMIVIITGLTRMEIDTLKDDFKEYEEEVLRIGKLNMEKE